METLSGTISNRDKKELGENKPRKLTEDEMIDIMSVMPDIKSAADVSSRENLKSMKVLIREQLKDIQITSLGIPDLKSEIQRQFEMAVVRPGSVVGVGAAEALAKPITQMALDSFHQSGSAKNVTFGVARIKELINATENPKKTSCSIYFKDSNLSFDDIIVKKRPIITEITVKDLVKGIPDIENYEQIEEPYWYDIYRDLYRDDFKAKSILRLEIDVNQLYAYKLTMEDICKAVEQDQPVICVMSPMPVGRIDIYPIERLITSKLTSMKIISHDNASLIFLTMVVVPALDKLKISGISGIEQIYPVETPVWSIVKEEQVATSVDRGYYIILNEIRMRKTGITVDKLIRLIEVAGMKVLKKRPNYILVQTESGESPTKIVNNKIKEDKEDEKLYEKKKREEGARIIRRPPSDIMVASNLIYADSTGSNFTELLSHPDIDSTRSICNNVHEIHSALGIEAARNFFISEMINVISFETYINPRHIVLLVDYMTSLGKVYGVTFSGISRQPIGALEKASFEKAMDTFKEAAGFGEEKELVGTSASIYVGKKALIGTGFSDQFLDSSKFDALRKQLDEDMDLAFDANAFNDAVNDLIDIDSGADILMLEGAEEEMFGVGVESEDELVVKSTKKKTRIYDGGNSMPDKRVHERRKGEIIRSKEFEEAAKELNNAPCLRPKPKGKVAVKKTGLRFTKGTTRDVPEKTGQLPTGLIDEMKKFSVKSPPVKADLPATTLPSPSLFTVPKIPTTIPDLPKAEEEPKIAIFDLDEFMK